MAEGIAQRAQRGEAANNKSQIPNYLPREILLRNFTGQVNSKLQIQNQKLYK